MAASRPPRGLILDLVTPMRTGGDLDEKGLARLLSRVVPHVQAVLVGGPCGGEGGRLGLPLKEELLQRVCLAVRARVPLLVWVTGSSREATLETAECLDRRLKREGYTGGVFWVDTPLLYQGNRGLPRHYREFTARFNRGCVLHNDPSLIGPLKPPFKRENIRTAILKDLCLEAVQGLICSGTLDRSQNYQKAVRAASGFRIYDGEEPRFLSHPSLSGIVSVGANLAPRGWQKITRSSLNLDANRKEYPDGLRQIWETGANISDLMSLYRDGPVPLIKLALFRTGVLESPFSYQGDADPQAGGRLLDWMDAHPRLTDAADNQSSVESRPGGGEVSGTDKPE